MMKLMKDTSATIPYGTDELSNVQSKNQLQEHYDFTPATGTAGISPADTGFPLPLAFRSYNASPFCPCGTILAVSE